MSISVNVTPWFVDYENYVVIGVLLKDLSYNQRKWFFLDVKKYFWDEPFLFQEYTDGMI